MTKFSIVIDNTDHRLDEASLTMALKINNIYNPVLLTLKDFTFYGGNSGYQRYICEDGKPNRRVTIWQDCSVCSHGELLDLRNLFLKVASSLQTCDKTIEDAIPVEKY